MSLPNILGNAGAAPSAPATNGRLPDILNRGPVVPSAQATSGSLPNILNTPAPVKGPDYFYTKLPSGATIGRSDQIDSSGIPFLGYRNPGDEATSTDPTRVATTFDPTKPAVVPAKSILTPRNVPNAPALKTKMGGDKNTELDHTQPLELAGSNDASNLRIEKGLPGQGFKTATDPLENSLAQDVAHGKLSLFDAQTAIAKAKGTKAPWTPVEKKSFLSKVGDYLNSIPDQSKLGIVKNTIAGIPKEAWNTLGPGRIQDALNADPEAAADLTYKDVAKSVVPAVGQFFGQPVADVAGVVQGPKTYNVPGIGEIKNIQEQAKENVQNGDNPFIAVLKATPNAIFDGLMIAGVTEKVFGGRPIVRGSVDLTDTNGIQVKDPVKSFRLSNPSDISQQIPGSMVEKLVTEKGGTLPKGYDAKQPTYFRLKEGPNGHAIGEVIQIRPSYFDTFMNKLKGDVSKVPDAEVLKLYSESQPAKELVASEKTPATTESAPAVIDNGQAPVVAPQPGIAPNSALPATIPAPHAGIEPQVAPAPNDSHPIPVDHTATTPVPEKAQIIEHNSSGEQFHVLSSTPETTRIKSVVGGHELNLDSKAIPGTFKTVPEARIPAPKTQVPIQKELKPLASELQKYPNIEKALPKGIALSDIRGSHAFGSSVKGGKYHDVDVAIFLKENHPSFKEIGSEYNRKVGNIEYHVLPANDYGRQIFDAMLDMKREETGKGVSKKVDLGKLHSQVQEPVKIPTKEELKAIPVPEEKPQTESSIQLNAELIPGLTKVVTEDVIPGAKGLAQGAAQAYKEIATLFNPAGQAPKEGVDIIMKNKGQFEKEIFRTEQAMKNIKKMWDKQPEEARLDFLAKVEAGETITGPFKDLAEMYKTRLDNAYKAITQFKEVPFIENFFPHFWEKPEAVEKEFMPQVFSKRPLEGPKTFLKHRVFATLEEGIKAGYKPVSTNPEELVQIYEQNAKKFVMAQQIKADMIEKGLWQFVKGSERAPKDFAKIEDAIAKIYFPAELKNDNTIVVQGGEYYAQKDVARMLNNYLSKDRIMDTAIGRGLMNVKNTLNAFQLGFSAFHLTMETLDTITTQVSIGISKALSGHPLAGLKDIVSSPAAPVTFFRDGQKFFNNDPALKDIEDAIFTGGASFRNKQYYKNTVLDTFLKNVREGNYLGATIRLPLSAVEATMRPLFSYYIPRLKVGAFRALYASELERLSSKIEAGKITQEEVARDTWNNIENRMGELNYDNLFWNRNLKTSLMLTTRAVGWNLGTVRELGGGLLQDTPREFSKVFKGQSEDFNFTPKMSYTLALFMVIGSLGAIYQYLHTGKKPEGVKDLYYPRNGAKDKSGEDYRVEFPSYLKDLYQFSHNPIQTAKNKSAPEFAAILELLNNKDFYGDYIRNTNDNATLQSKQVALFLLDQLTPFTASNVVQLNKGTASIEQKAEAFFGIIKAPKEVIQNQYQAALSQIYQDTVGTKGAQTPEQKAIANLKSEARTAIKNGDYSILDQMVKDGIITARGRDTFIKNAKLTSDQRMYKGLPKSAKAKLDAIKNQTQ